MRDNFLEVLYGQFGIETRSLLKSMSLKLSAKFLTICRGLPSVPYTVIADQIICQSRSLLNWRFFTCHFSHLWCFEDYRGQHLSLFGFVVYLVEIEI